ncbi:MAG: CDP-alcohol phosphatidyltransferase family protein [Acidimicrobiia bacterium]|nr:CDP-alcohol phosphatidyltransferase family protein [Acidimicrobiia bacterium]
MTLAADLLTTSRGLIAIGLIAAISGRHLSTVAVLISVAWLTDLFDGRAARAGAGSTRLGRWDLGVDTMVGVGALVGLLMAGAIPVWLAWGALLLLGVPFAIFRHPTLSMVLQAIAYAGVLALLWREAGAIRWLPPLTIATILVIGFNRFRETTLPTFFSGFLELLPERGGERR